MSDTNGRLKLTWPQVVWGIGVLFAALGVWFDVRELKVRLEKIEHKVEQGIYTREQIDAMKGADDAEHRALRHDSDAIRDQVQDLERRAGVRAK